MTHNPDWFQSVTKKSATKAPSDAKTLEIDRVAPGSPAADLGLQRGDKFVSVNGKPALTADIPLLLAQSSSAAYRFYLPRDSASLDVKTKGLPLGIETSASSAGIAEQYKSKGEFEKAGLLTLWERRDYERIGQACAMSNARLNKYNLIGKLTGKPKSFSFTELMTAICEIETGNAASGYKALGKYEDDHAYAETSEVQAIINFYHGLKAKAQGNTGAYQQLVESAFESYPQSERLREEARSLGLEIDRADRRVGLSLPSAQSLKFLEGGKGTTSLHDILQAMTPTQILPLCLMTTFRGNGPYNDALIPYISLQPKISERLHPLVVLTDVAEKRKDRPHWFSNEDLAKKVKCPFMVLHGDLADVLQTLTPRGAPEFFALDRSGTVVWSGSLDADYDYWNMLAQASH